MPQPPSLSRRLRVTIVGHASPRWLTAGSNTQADKQNEQLANRRADTVFFAVERLIWVKLGPAVTIERNVSLAPGTPQPRLALSASSDGSRDALQAGRSRQSNEESDRRVDVSIELVETKAQQAGRSFSEEAKTRDWSVTINRFELFHPFIAGGGIEVAIRNRHTGKEVLATAKLLGGGMPSLNPFAHSQDTGRKRVWFWTREDVPHHGVRRN